MNHGIVQTRRIIVTSRPPRRERHGERGKAVSPRLLKCGEFSVEFRFMLRILLFQRIEVFDDRFEFGD